MHDIFLSIVMVVDRWIDDVPRIVREVEARLAGAVTDYELILVDNGSPADADATYRALTAEDGHANIQVFRLINRVPYEAAAWAGVESSLGDYVLVFEPYSETLAPLDDALTLCGLGRDLVLIVNDAPRAESGIERMLRRLYRTVFKVATRIDLRVDAAQYRLLSKRVISYLLQQPDPASRYRTLPTSVGFPRGLVRYSAPRRPYPGRTFLADVRRANRTLFSNSIAPLRFASMLSLAGALLNVCYSLYVIVLALTRSHLQPGWTTLSLQQSGMFFLWSLLAFVVTEYMVILIQGQRSATPYYVLDEMNSAVLTHRQRLNVEAPRRTPERTAPPPGA